MTGGMGGRRMRVDQGWGTRYVGYSTKIPYGENYATCSVGGTTANDG